jgi:hypothetical protein
MKAPAPEESLTAMTDADLMQAARASRESWIAVRHELARRNKGIAEVTGERAAQGGDRKSKFHDGTLIKPPTLADLGNERTAPNPTPVDEFASVSSAERLQKIDCLHRLGCLDLAARCGWRAFACGQCRAYAPTSSDDDRAMATRRRFAVLDP